MTGPTTKRPPSRSEELANVLRKKLQEAYDCGAASEAIAFLIQQFEQLRKLYSEHLKALRKEAGL